GSSGAKTPSANNTSLTSVSSASSSVIVDSSSSDSFRDNLPVTIAPDDSAIRYSGRVSLTATAALYDWANIQIEFRVNAPQVELLINDEKNDYNLFVNGQWLKTISAAGNASYPVTLGQG